jgi:hypothetical protein
MTEVILPQKDYGFFYQSRLTLKLVEGSISFDHGTIIRSETWDREQKWKLIS